MNFAQGYKVVFVKCEETSLVFFTEMLGFKLYEKIEIQGKAFPVLQLTGGDFMMLVEKQTIDLDTVVLRTDDCVRDYYLFKQKSIATLTKPRYVDNGLELCFSDPSGNRIIMIEERDYSETN